MLNRSLLNREFLLFDGAMGTMLQRRGLKAGELPELYNLTHPEIIEGIHREYVAAGCDIVTTNTFGANAHKLGGKAGPDQVIAAAVELARRSGARYVALDIGPIGMMGEPFGPMKFEDAYAMFREQVLAGAKAGADLVLIETMSDLLEARAAVLAVKENCALPVFASVTFSADGRTFLGADARCAAIGLNALGVDAVGVNCSLGPDALLPIVRDMVEYSQAPVLVQANAGLPQIVNHQTVYAVGPAEYAQSAARMADMGVTIFGGCCGTEPETIRALRRMLDARRPTPHPALPRTAFTGAQNMLMMDGGIVVVGEKINPSASPTVVQALRSGDYDSILSLAIAQQEAGAQMLDINVGLPEIDEAEVLPELVKRIQAVCPLPLIIDSSNPQALEAAVRVYNGKPVINSVNGKAESLNAVLPIAKRYGAGLVALTLDENGIPATAAARMEVAKRILARASEAGIPRQDILLDCLAMTVSTHQAAARETLTAIKLARETFHVHTLLGTSNISFGLPRRDIVNAAFLSAAFAAGLNFAIMDACTPSAMEAVEAARVLSGLDAGAKDFIQRHAGSPDLSTSQVDTSELPDVQSLIISGRKSQIAEAVRQLLLNRTPEEVINGEFIPALDVVSDRFESGEMFLPQLIAAAETVKAGFEVVRNAASAAPVKSRGDVVLATVKDDIHDIGKNIVKMLLQNYGFNVIDLGKDVEPQRVVDAVLKGNIRLVGLSALMTTTMKNMGVTIQALRAAGAHCKVMVGGAVLTPEYARMVGADYYASDATESARIAAQVLEGKVD